MFINGEFVDDELVRLETKQTKDRLRDGSSEEDPVEFEIRAREIARRLVIQRVVLRQEALKDQTPIRPELVQAAMGRFYAQSPKQANCLLPRDEAELRANVETDLRIERLLAFVCEDVPKPSGRELAAYYQRAKNSLLEPEKIHAAHIVKNVDETTSESEARAAIERTQALLEQGVPFEKVADEHSDCPGRGGDLGLFGRGEMVDEFDAVVFELPNRAVSGIFRTRFGFHIVKVYERKAEHLPKFNEIRQNLETLLWNEAVDERVREFLNHLSAKAEVRRSK